MYANNLSIVLTGLPKNLESLKTEIGQFMLKNWNFEQKSVWSLEKICQKYFATLYQTNVSKLCWYIFSTEHKCCCIYLKYVFQKF